MNLKFKIVLVLSFALFALSLSSPPALASCTFSLSGDYTMSGTDGNCSQANTIDGVDNGNMIVGNASYTWTIPTGKTFVWPPGKFIIHTAGSISLAAGAKLRQGYMYYPVTSGTTCGTGTAPTYYSRTQTITDYLRQKDLTGKTGTTYYRDADGDTYGTPNTTTTSCTGAPSGYVANNTDCYDSNANAKPGQTSYFTTNRGDGSYDYDCSGSATNQATYYDFGTAFSEAWNSYYICTPYKCNNPPPSAPPGCAEGGISVNPAPYVVTTCGAGAGGYSTTYGSVGDCNDGNNSYLLFSRNSTIACR